MSGISDIQLILECWWTNVTNLPTKYFLKHSCETIWKPRVSGKGSTRIGQQPSSMAETHNHEINQVDSPIRHYPRNFRFHPFWLTSWANGACPKIKLSRYVKTIKIESENVGPSLTFLVTVHTWIISLGAFQTDSWYLISENSRQQPSKAEVVDNGSNDQWTSGHLSAKTPNPSPNPW